jgi:glycosyltransferase involved in cell wall biosynthesis
MVFAGSPLPGLKSNVLGREGEQIGTWLSQVAEEFSHAGDLEIVWVTIQPGGAADSVEKSHNQTFIRLAHSKMSFDLALGYRLVKYRIRRLLALLQPSVVHAWGTERLESAVIEVTNCPSILSMQGIITRYSSIGCLPDIWQWRAIAKAEPRWVKAATVVTSESQWGLDQLHALGRTERTQQVEYGVHPSFYKLQWDPDPADPVLLFAGTIDKRKGVDVLAEAAAMAADRKWRLEIAGDGPLKAALEARNLPNVKWLGNLDWPTLQDRLTKAWGFILPTRADTSPNSVKEARVVGLPVVTTPSGGQSGYIIDGQNGFLVDPLDAPGLLAACDKVTASLDTAITMGRARHQQDRDYFRPQNTASSFLLLYRELSGANPA